MTDPATTTDLANASAGVTNGYASVFDLGPVVTAVVGLSAIVFSVMYAASAAERYDRVRTVVKAADVVIYYAAAGFFSVVAVAVVATPFYFVGRADPATQTAVGKYVLGGLVVMGVLATIGYGVTEHLVPRLQEHHQQVTGDAEVPADAD